MSKIDEFEQKIMTHGMTAEDFVEYEKLLKRVRDNFLKRQHCYTTAIQFPPEYAEQAVRLIQYGLDHFEDSWFSTYMSYLYIGHIYERINEYQKAFDSYVSAQVALGSDHPEYVADLAKDLMWMKLHIDSFQYSKELEDYYLCYEKADEISKAFVNNEFRLAVVNIVISRYHEKNDEAKQAIETATRICQPDYIGKIHDVLARHRYHESLKTTPEAIDFLRHITI